MKIQLVNGYNGDEVIRETQVASLRSAFDVILLWSDSLKLYPVGVIRSVSYKGYELIDFGHYSIFAKIYHDENK